MERSDFEDGKMHEDQKEQELSHSVKDKIHDLNYKMRERKGIQPINDMSDIFINPDERQITTIRSGYIINLLHGGQLVSGVGILTDSRFYYRGKSYRQTKWMVYKTNEESIIELQNITATGFIFNRNIIIAAVAAVVTLVELVLIILGLFEPPENAVEYWLVTLVGAVITILLWALYIWYRRAVYQISHAGGMIAIKISAYGMKQLHEFDRKLHQAKDEKIKELSGRRMPLTMPY